MEKFKLKENEVLHIPTYEESVEISQTLDILDLKWTNGKRYTTMNQWDNYGTKTCYNINKGEFGSRDYWEDDRRKVVITPEVFRLRVLNWLLENKLDKKEEYSELKQISMSLEWTPENGLKVKKVKPRKHYFTKIFEGRLITLAAYLTPDIGNNNYIVTIGHAIRNPEDKERYEKYLSEKGVDLGKVIALGRAKKPLSNIYETSLPVFLVRDLGGQFLDNFLESIYEKVFLKSEVAEFIREKRKSE